MSPIRFKGGEFAFIDWIRGQTPEPGKRVVVGPGDDACVIDVGPETRVSLTTDMLLEGTHFELDRSGTAKTRRLSCRGTRTSPREGLRGRVTPRELGWKAVGVSLSDIAAMGMEPLVCVAAVGFPASCGRRFAEQLYRGMRALADRFDVPIAGGDVTSWDASRVVVCVTALGRRAGAEPVLRSGAKPGDVIVVTGELGGSLLGRHVTFMPRVAEAIAIARGFSPHAMIDVSDGLSSDLAHIAVESAVGAVIEEEKVPISPDAHKASRRSRTRRSPLDHALNDGEDFELVVTLSEADAKRLLARPPFKTRVTEIGRIVEGNELHLRTKSGKRRVLEPGGYEHPLRT